MTLYEPISLTYVLIMALIFAFSGELFHGFVSRYERDCYQSNVQLLEEGRQGPLRKCQ